MPAVAITLVTELASPVLGRTLSRALVQEFGLHQRQAQLSGSTLAEAQVLPGSGSGFGAHKVVR